MQTRLIDFCWNLDGSEIKYVKNIGRKKDEINI